MSATPPRTGTEVTARLESARERLDAVIAAVEGRDSCRATVDLLVAVSRDLNGVGFALVSNAMSQCAVTG
ncbi:MAG TPA: metal-sensing transcriptional repressor, partial [Dietzia sp.]|nr:metal-sensing transcriptional repressor [Dietzia sp.]